MRSLIHELRRRQVLRTLGLYVGACWLLIEVANVLVPTFGAPLWTLRALVVAAIVGAPVVLVLAWLYNITEQGVVHVADSPDTAIPAFGRKMDFVVIGVLTVALIFSVYLNVSNEAGVTEASEPISVLIADFQNNTGEAIFDGVLEQALNIGIEGAPRVVSFARTDAEDLAKTLQPGLARLEPEAARLVAIREGVQLVLAGSIDGAGQGYRLELRGVDPLSGELSFEFSEDAANKDAVLTAVGALSADVREALGDETLERGEAATAETFTAASIEAAGAYREAVQLAYEGRHEVAVERFEKAVALDPTLGRAYAGWATSEFRLGKQEQAEALWRKALSLMGTMTERERLRTLGTYYVGVTRDYEKSVETFTELVGKYPADAAGWNNLAVSSFLTLDFKMAAEEGERVLDMFPRSRLYRSNFALYAMYAGDFEAAAGQARALIEDSPEYGTAYLPLAISLLAMGDSDGARAAYQRMRAATTSEHRESVALLGLADISIYLGEFDQAEQTLLQGIEEDVNDGVSLAAATKQIALAEAFAAAGDYEMAIAAANEALESSNRESIRVASAIVFLESGDIESASAIAEELSGKLQAQTRAYGMMIEASVLRRSGQYVRAIDELRAAIGLADLWRIRYELGRAYLDAGFSAEAFDELESCLERRGEASAMFLDDTPTYRYLADLFYWVARAQEELSMRGASENYRAFLKLRPQGGVMVDDARERLRQASL